MIPNYNRFPGPGDLWYGHDDDDDDHPDVTDDRDDGWWPDDEPDVDYISGPEADYIYDPLSRKGFE